MPLSYQYHKLLYKGKIFVLKVTWCRKVFVRICYNADNGMAMKLLACKKPNKKMEGRPHFSKMKPAQLLL